DGRAAALAASAVPAPAWLNAAVPRAAAMRNVAPSRSEEEPAIASPLGDDAGRRFRRGLLIHRVLQNLPEIADAAREAAGGRYLARAAAGLEETRRAAILDECRAVLRHPDFAPIFTSGAHVEAPVSGTVGTVTISGQIDRLCVTESEVLVVDYK